MQIKLQKAHEGEAVSDLILRLVIRQVIESLEHQNFEHEYGIKLGAATFVPRGAPQAFLQKLAKSVPRYVLGEAL
jgi:hypothetical protein